MRPRSWRPHVDKIDRLIERIGSEIDLNASTRDLDDLLAALDPDDWHPEARREVLINYLGFPFWDVLALPVTSGREMGELNEILVDRISPQDVHTLQGLPGHREPARHRLWPLRGLLLARLSGERLSAGPIARRRPADRDRLRLGRHGFDPGPVQQDRLQEERLHQDPRFGGELPSPQQGADRSLAPLRGRDRGLSARRPRSLKPSGARSSGSHCRFRSP